MARPRIVSIPGEREALMFLAKNKERGQAYAHASTR